MKKLILILILLLAAFIGKTQKIIPIKHSVTMNTAISKQTKTIDYYAFTTCIDTTINLPLWVSHSLTKNIIDTLDDFHRDRPKSPRYPKDNDYPILKSDAYSSTGYDHGHLAPAKDFKYNSKAWYECFHMTNMSPQHGCLNQKAWCHLEGHCRNWAGENENTITYIVTGFVPNKYIDTLCINKKLKIFVPEEFYKVLLVHDTILNETKGIAFIMSNIDIDNQDLEQYKTTIRNVESITHLDFFTFIPDHLEKNAESHIGEFKFTTEKIDCPNKNCDDIYKGNRFLPADRVKYKCK